MDTAAMMCKAVKVATYFVLLGIECLIGYTLQYYCIARVGEAVSAQLRSSMFESLMRREISYFDDERNGVGALTTRLANDARLVHEGTGESLSNQFQAFFTLLSGMIIAFTASWKIALVVIAPSR
jgi:ATP-binding cassette subfamily B (MDR/TAP) protein 1